MALNTSQPPLTSGDIITALGYTPSDTGGVQAVVISTNTTAESGKSYILTAALTLTLPTSPQTGFVIWFQNISGTNCTIARNGTNIMSLAEDITLDLSYTSAKLVYIDSTQGWLITDANTTQVNPNPGGLSVTVISTNTTTASGGTYVLTASLTVTLPATPTAGALVNIINRSGVNTCILARNGQNLMGLAEDMTLDSSGSLELVFSDSTRGWVLL